MDCYNSWSMVLFMALKSTLQIFGVDVTVTSWKCCAVFCMLWLRTVESLKVKMLRAFEVLPLPRTLLRPCGVRPRDSAIQALHVGPSIPYERLTPLVVSEWWMARPSNTVLTTSADRCDFLPYGDVWCKPATVSYISSRWTWTSVPTVRQSSSFVSRISTGSKQPT